MSDKRNPWQPGSEVAKENNLGSNSNNGDPSTLNGNQRQATPRDNLSWIWERYAERAPNWKHVDYGIAYTSQGHMNITTWRLAVPGGWIYKVTEWDEEGHFTVQICFVPNLSEASAMIRFDDG